MSAPAAARDPRRIRGWIAASVILVLAAPFITHEAMRAAYLADYSGICGPHAPDIPAHPCTYAEYADEFAAGFAAFGAWLLDGLGMLVVAALVSLAWLIRGVRRARAAGAG